MARRWRRFWIGLGLLGGAAVVAVLMRPRTRNLQDVAVRLGPYAVTYLDTGKLTPDDYWLGDYHWVSSSVFLGDWAVPRTESHLALHDLQTGHNNVLQKINLLYGETGEQETVSPDSRRLLWYDADNFDIHVATWDGKQPQLWSGRFLSKVLATKLDNEKHDLRLRWDDDNRHWIGFLPEDAPKHYVDVLVGDVQRPQDVRVLPIAPDSLLSEMGRKPHTLRTGGIVVHGDRVVYTDYDEAFVLNGKSGHILSLAEIDLSQQGKTVWSRTITLPHDCEIEEAVLSPDGKRVALITSEQQIAPLAALLHRFVSRYTPHTRRVGRLYVGEVREGDLQELGELPLEKKYDEMQYLQWLPDGKSVSYCRDNSLWRVPVP